MLVQCVLTSAVVDWQTPRLARTQSPCSLQTVRSPAEPSVRSIVAETPSVLHHLGSGASGNTAAAGALLRCTWLHSQLHPAPGGGPAFERAGAAWLEARKGMQ